MISVVSKQNSTKLSDILWYIVSVKIWICNLRSASQDVV